jgi:hypothetical protein
MPAGMQRSADEVEARRRGRRSVMIAYYAIVAGFILLAAGNVTYQVWAPLFRSYSPVNCQVGLSELARAVDRARQAASSVSEEGEDVALAQFRTALSPEWDNHDAIAATCQKSAELASLLDVVERLRYAEERAVRREVSDLAPLRRKVGQLRTNQLER